jgi:CDP-diacylglycerol--glycerol-3-phosphate 3-phosphatidyltransferase
MADFVFISEKNRQRYLKIITPVGNFFARVGVHPNVLSIVGFILSIIAGIIYSTGNFFWAAWVVVLAGTCDTLDGQIARATNKNSSFGAFFDSTLDRYSDMFLFLGLAYHFAGGRKIILIEGSRIQGDPSPWVVIIIILAIVGSFMVSYTRARAEGLGIECKKGMMQRPERITLLIIGSLLGSLPKIGPFLMICTLIILALSSNITAMYRIFFVRNRLLRENQIK